MVWGMCGMCVLYMECSVCGVLCVYSMFCILMWVCVCVICNTWYICLWCVYVCCVGIVCGMCVGCLLEAVCVFTGLGGLGTWALHSLQRSVKVGGIRD